jgi:threonine synthase
MKEEVDSGRLELAEQCVVCICTGHGLKDPDIVAGHFARPETVPAELGVIEEMVAE